MKQQIPNSSSPFTDEEIRSFRKALREYVEQGDRQSYEAIGKLFASEKVRAKLQARCGTNDEKEQQDIVIV